MLTEIQSRPAMLQLLSQAGQLLADLPAVILRWREEHEAGVWSDDCFAANTDQMLERLLAAARVVHRWSDGKAPNPVDVCEMLTPCEFVAPSEFPTQS